MFFLLPAAITLLRPVSSYLVCVMWPDVTRCYQFSICDQVLPATSCDQFLLLQLSFCDQFSACWLVVKSCVTTKSLELRGSRPEIRPLNHVGKSPRTTWDWSPQWGLRSSPSTMKIRPFLAEIEMFSAESSHAGDLSVLLLFWLLGKEGMPRCRRQSFETLDECVVSVIPR